MTAAQASPDIVPVPRKVTGRPRKTDRAQLVAAARAHGFRGLTVGVVTAACGVKYSTFYRSLPDVEALRAALVDDVLAEATIPALSNWREQVQMCTDILRAVLAAHPGMAQAIDRLDDMPDWIGDARCRCYDAMTEAGIPAAAATAGVNAVFVLALAEPGRVGWREIAQQCDGIAGGTGEQ